MKKIILLFAMIASPFAQTLFAQDNTTKQSVPVLTLYYDLKDALVNGNPGTAAAKAIEFVSAVNNSGAIIPDNSMREALLKDAGFISESTDLKIQRQYFAGLSTTMVSLAKRSKLSDSPVYQQYCPMKKSDWLSSEKEIKNPYFGSQMLGCGKVIGAIK